MTSSIYVIKLGGHAMDDESLLDAFVKDIRQLVDKNYKFVIVHGGGPHINELLTRLGIQSEFSDGLRITSEPVLEAVEMALCGKVNKAVTRLLEKNGVRAAGISGQDGNTLEAQPINFSLGRVGKVTGVNPRLISALLEGGFMPVIAPVALDANYQPLNVNADTAAGAIAGELQAAAFVLISDVPGVLNQHGNLLPHLTAAQIGELCASGIVSGGMLPKVECCLAALALGCQKALILDGRRENGLLHFIENGESVGTEITK